MEVDPDRATWEFVMHGLREIAANADAAIRQFPNDARLLALRDVLRPAMAVLGVGYGEDSVVIAHDAMVRGVAILAG